MKFCQGLPGFVRASADDVSLRKSYSRRRSVFAKATTDEVSTKVFGVGFQKTVIFAH